MSFLLLFFGLLFFGVGIGCGSGRDGQAWGKLEGRVWGGLLDWWGMFVVTTYVDLPS